MFHVKPFLKSFLLLALCVLAGCLFDKPNASRVVLSESTTALARQLDRAERLGWITNETENDLIDDLVKVDRLLLGEDVFIEGYDCSEKSRADCIGSVLDTIEAALIAAEQEGDKNGS